MDNPNSSNSDSLGLGSAELAERVAHAMSATANAYVQTLVRELAERGFDDLTPNSVRLLSLIDGDGSRSTHLAQRLRRTKQAVGQTVTELELRGYVERARDPRDARARLIQRTGRGDAVLEAGLDIKRDLDAMVVAAIGMEELHGLARGLQRLTALFRSEDDSQRH